MNWREPVSDGFAAFGPGSATPEETGTCAFTVGNCGARVGTHERTHARQRFNTLFTPR